MASRNQGKIGAEFSYCWGPVQRLGLLAANRAKCFSIPIARTYVTAIGHPFEPVAPLIGDGVKM